MGWTCPVISLMVCYPLPWGSLPFWNASMSAATGSLGPCQVPLASAANWNFSTLVTIPSREMCQHAWAACHSCDYWTCRTTACKETYRRLQVVRILHGITRSLASKELIRLRGQRHWGSGSNSTVRHRKHHHHVQRV